MHIPLKKITLAGLPLAGLVLMAPLTFAHNSEGEHGRVHDELGEEHQEGHETLNAESKTFNSQRNSSRARNREQRRLAREHRALHENVNVQHEDYHDGNRYQDWVDDRLNESLTSHETPRFIFVRPLTAKSITSWGSSAAPARAIAR
jgi:hypothetical protein